MIGLIAQLFTTFFLIGLLNFGGGGAMLSLIQVQVVNIHGWISEGMFTDIVGISQSTPGPIAINCATYVGYEVLHGAGASQMMSVLGSATATFAVMLPSFFVFFLIMKAFNRFHRTAAFRNTMTALKPATAGLIGAAALVLTFRFGLDGSLPKVAVIEENFPDWRAWAMAGTAFVLGYKKILGPIAIILASGVTGLLIY